MTFPLNAGEDETTFTETYTTKSSTNAKSKAYKNVSVNPLLKTNGLEDETNNLPSVGSNSAPVVSMLFFEIRNGPHAQDMPTNQKPTSHIQNRLFPTSSNISDVGTNKENTPSYKVKIYDSQLTHGVTNKPATYHASSDTPNSNIGLDIKNRDYFIILNPNIQEDDTTSVRPHFAKITRLSSFDSFGDGVEFTPKYKGNIPKGTEFEIYKGPLKTETDVVAVSYGLRGDTSASTDKFDKICIVNRPTFYFYNDRLEEDDQLNYNEKYTITITRHWGTFTFNLTDTVGELSQYEQGSLTGSKYFQLANADYIKLNEGMSLIKSDGTYLGNIESKSTNGVTGKLALDYYRPSGTLNSGGGTDTTDIAVKVGTTIQSVVFKTERKYDNTIQNLGRSKLDVLLVDNNLTTDETDSGGTFNPIFWHKAFPNMKRSSTDSTTTTTSLDGTLNGPSKYLRFVNASLKNDKIPMALETSVNSPRNKMSKYAEIVSVDNAGIQHLKYKLDSKMVIRNGIFSDSIKFRKLPNTVTTNSNTLEFNNNTSVNTDNKSDYDYSAILGADSIVLIGEYYYRVSSITSKTNETKQSFQVSHKKKKSENTWTSDTTPPTVTNADIYISHYSNNKFNLGFSSDTEVITSQNNRLTLEEHTIDKDNSKMHNMRISMNAFTNHETLIDYGDKNLQYVSILEPNRSYYQDSPKHRMFYYGGGYTIHEEVFNGLVDTLDNYNENGLMGFRLTGRDKTANLITNTVNKNLNFSDDIVYSTLVPSLDLSNTFTVYGAFGKEGGSTLRVDGNKTGSLVKYVLLFDENYEFIGEVDTSIYVTSTNHTAITLRNYLTKDVADNSSVYYYNPLNSSSRYLAGAKAIGVNSLEAEYPTDFTHTSEKGLVFNNGMNFTYASNSFSYADLKLTSNDGNYLEDGSLGYNIYKPKGLEKTITSGGTVADLTSQNDNFLLKLAKENEDYVTEINKDISSSLYLHVVDTVKVAEGVNIITLAPNFPVLLGTTDKNLNDTRYAPSGNNLYNSSMYFVNSNAPIGGYMHRLQNRFKTIYAHDETYKFTDFQKFKENTIIPPYDSADAFGQNPATSIYRTGNRPHKITGYTSGGKVLGNGYVSLTNVIKDTDWWKDSENKDNLTEDRDTYSNDLNEDDLNQLLNNDYRARPFYLYATGDLLPDSFLRHNSLGFSSNTNSLDNFGLMFESNGTEGSDISHSWSGKTKAVVKRDSNYELSEISSSTISNPTLIRRWGIIRLVEATFDWHFNSVDFEALKDRYEIPELDIGSYVKYRKDGDDAYLITYNIFNPDGDDLNELKNKSTINMTQIYLARPNIEKDYFNYNLLKPTSNSGSIFYPPNVFLPIVSEVKPFSGTSTALTSSYTKTDTLGATLNNGDTVIDISGNQTNFAVGDTIYVGGKYVTLLSWDSVNNRFNISAYSGNTVSSGTTVFLANAINLRNSIFHASTDIHATNTYYHYSKVISAMCGFNIVNSDNVAYKVARPNGGNIYNTCVGLFRNLKRSIKGTSNDNEDGINLKLVSSPLNTNQGTSFSTYYTGFLNAGSGIGNINQHAANIMVRSNTTTVNDVKQAFLGIKTKSYPFVNKTDVTSNTGAGTYHGQNQGGYSEYGELFTAQMMIKPQFNMKESDEYTSGDLSISANNDISFTMDSTSEHHWLNFVPNLEGYYVVSNRIESGSSGSAQYLPTLEASISSYNSKGIPKYIGKIISHTINSSGTHKIHKLKFDTDIDTATQGSHFRLMRISDTTFDNTPDYIEINTMHDSGLEYKILPENLLTGETTRTKQLENEGLYSMYMLLNIDENDSALSTNYIERRTISDAASILPVSNGEEIDCYITDGINSQRKSLTVTLTNETSTSAPQLKFEYDGTLTGNGCVSFGKTFAVTIPTALKTEPTHCYLGTTFSIGSVVENEIETIAKDSNLDVDIEQSLKQYTGLVVDSVSSNVITLLNTPTNIEINDVIYNQSGYLIGKITAKSTSSPFTITIGGGMHYSPLQYDEITTRDKKTMVSLANFSDVESLNAINYLASKKQLDYQIKNKQIKFRNLEDSYGLRRYEISYKSNNRLMSVSGNTSMFDRATKVIVIGDRVKAEIAMPTDGAQNTVRYIDTSIKNINDAKIKANQLMVLHSQDIRKINLKLQKEGLELLEAGDILTLDFPNHNIPRDDYIVFDIQNVLSGVSEITVGTFDKNIAERLAELDAENKNANITNFSTNSVTSSVGNFLTDSFKIRNQSIKYTISTDTLAGGTTIGFGNTIGFSGQIGLGSTTSSITTTYESERDL